MTDIPLLAQPTRDAQVIEATYLDAVVREGVFMAGAFQMALPKNWTVDTAGAKNPPTVDTPIIELARAVPGLPEAFGASHDAAVQIWCVLLPRVINGVDWLRRWTQTQGYEIHAIRELPTKNGIMGDVVVTSAKTGRLHRMVTIKDGDLIFLVDGSIDPKGAPQDANLQEIALMAAMRFKLLAPSRTRYAEPVSEETLSSRIGQIAFFLPQSWDKNPAEDAPEDGALRSYVTRVQEEAAGTLIVAMGGDDTTAEAMEETLVAKLNNQGHQIGKATMTLDAKKGDYRFSAWRRTGQVGADRGVYLLTLRGGYEDMPVSIAMLSPSPQTAFEAYAVNRRVFEIVLESHAVGLR
ncbi:hypothetical protein HKX54_15405 [Sulfitobacter sp. M57]|uniref:hypothetical protein n=1 Tax=unclassified Sulfitobacter TaxID=196795 RepID=UPI0023E160DA|nr:MULTISPECIES: hypothetical protein [unclassified Sulfitobacter]MDF3415854.1 hypothetical protein [Sulfitobacter sp. KE5]MDF3423334.1 hypothetical protein [Sulfitobacter sp. KE43]MDF3434400.1 hypothetical protein [Sulfitobacter sp. KE42]MDF3460040.1 hypothetical protein [Sulfitobacter sp. S74]MDF3463938.1 hypothetical protein [Sulfitobacter sp. Ks18]